MDRPSSALLMCDLCRDSWAPRIHERYIQRTKHANVSQVPCSRKTPHPKAAEVAARGEAQTSSLCLC